MHTVQSRAGDSGFTLVEVLVAVFVLAVGMLGVANLQVTSKRTNFESVQRSNATFFAQELLERIRANTTELSVYTDGGLGRTIVPGTDSGLDDTDCVSAACDATDVAMYDLYEFSEALRGIAEAAGANVTGGLVSPTVCVTGPEESPGYVTVAIAWRGMTKLSSPITTDCGAGSGLYDDSDGNADVHRRVLLVETFID